MRSLLISFDRANSLGDCSSYSLPVVPVHSRVHNSVMKVRSNYRSIVSTSVKFVSAVVELRTVWHNFGRMVRLGLNKWLFCCAFAECDLRNLSSVCMCVGLFKTPHPKNGISTGNFLMSSLDLGSRPKFNLEWYFFSNRSFQIALLQINW